MYKHLSYPNCFHLCVTERGGRCRMGGTTETFGPAKQRRFQNDSRTQVVQRADLLDGYITVTDPEGKK